MMTIEWSQKQIAFSLASLLILLLAVAALGSQRLLFDQHWPLKWIEVQGEFERVSAEQIRATTAPLLGNGFFGVDLDRVRSTIEALPWVRLAEIRKRWPDRIQVQITEHEPMARWGEKELVSKLGEVFIAQSAVRIEGLPILHGPDDTAPQMIEFYARFQDRLLGTGLDVRELFLSRRGAWRARLNGGLEIELGRHQPLQRVSRLVSVLEDLGLDPARKPARIDLRYTNGFAVAWQATEPVQVLAVINRGVISGNP